MKYSVLASGSTGNTLYVETNETRILIDAGISCKQLELRLKEIGVDPTTLNAIFISHEHIDHVKGLGVLTRRYHIPVYMNEATWSNLPTSIGAVPLALQNILESGKEIDLYDFHITTIPISHDAANPMAFHIQTGNERLAVITDLGYVHDGIIEQIKGVDTLIWESNHDVEMLMMGNYPWHVKRRIISDKGHLSNEDSAEALLDAIRGEGENIHLAHLSRENNLIDLARLTMSQTLTEAGLKVGIDVHIHDTYHDRPTPLQEARIKVLR